VVTDEALRYPVVDLLSERSILSTNGAIINTVHLPVTEREEMRRMHWWGGGSLIVELNHDIS
jgi:hypothetical protein